MRSLTFAACGNKTLFSIIFTTSPLAKSWIRACTSHRTVPYSDHIFNYILCGKVVTFQESFFACKRKLSKTSRLLRLKKRLLRGNNISTITMTESDNNIHAVIYYVLSPLYNLLQLFTDILAIGVSKNGLHVFEP